MMISRRSFLRGSAALAGLGVSGTAQRVSGAEPPPEVTRIRLPQTPSMCQTPVYLAAELLKAEGFHEVELVKVPGAHDALGPGVADLGMVFVGPLLLLLDEAVPIVILGGGHVGCFELIATDRIRAIRDLKGRSIAIRNAGATEHVFLASMLAHVGLDPGRDVTWVPGPGQESARMLQDGKVDAFMAFPPVAQQFRGQGVGQVIVNSAVDRPWSQYFCCVLAGHREFVARHPVATKRALRALLKSTDLCALEPERMARALVDRGFTTRYEDALQTMKDLPYRKWREYEPEDTVRFYALRLREAGMIKANPQRLITSGTDWRWFNALKRELKG